jgi:SAM-dependent methyltransferase
MTLPQAYSDELRVRIWLEIREPLERQLEPLGQAAMAALQPLPGQRVLDIGCGIGGTPLALARAVGSSGQVVGADLLQPAIDVARRDPGLPRNVTFLCGDVQSYPFHYRFVRRRIFALRRDVFRRPRGSVQQYPAGAASRGQAWVRLLARASRKRIGRTAPSCSLVLSPGPADRRLRLVRLVLLLGPGEHS